MIVVRLNGGIGAQMIQYAIGKKLSLTNNTKLFLDDAWFKFNKDPIFPREFKLDKLNVQYELVDRSKIFWKIKLSHRFHKYIPFTFKVIKEKDHTQFDPTILKLGNNLVLDGYWNSYKYFDSIKEILFKEFIPKEKPNNKNSNALSKIQNSNSVSLHFRRGDYAKTDFHGMLDQIYYNNALEIITKQVSNPELFIFSDEPQWVLENIKFDYPYQLIDFNKDENNYWDIELMRNCKHNIIANSSFSWWGAYLNKNPNKIVVSPKIWFAEKKIEMDDFIPSSWIRI